jgi:hypothetical protein
MSWTHHALAVSRAARRLPAAESLSDMSANSRLTERRIAGLVAQLAQAASATMTGRSDRPTI